MLQEITENEISYAEQILFGRRGVFDQERKQFIKCLETCDLQAVPGSGKTTVLLAKLLIIEKYLPFQSGKAVLVLSHTNAAVNEIKAKISIHCPKLFQYPNFVGTIQSFVDLFLATPFYNTKFKKRIVRIDNEIYENVTSKFSEFFTGGFTNQEQNNAKNFLRNRDQYKNYRFKRSQDRIILVNGINGDDLIIKKPKGNTRSENYRDWNDAEKGEVRDWIFKYKLSIMKNGLLCFDDAYFLAKEYIFKIPRITNILEARFSYVFVDEMQDMEKHQYDLLEQLFWNNGNARNIFQRIGDKNQAIFNGNVYITDFWIDRPTRLNLTGSHRLSSFVANIVEKFALNPMHVIGLNTNADGSQINIKPHLFVYVDSSVTKVISKFSQVIAALLRENKIPNNGDNKFKAICWTTIAEEEKIRLNSYFNQFSLGEHKPKIDFSCIESYLLEWDKQRKDLEHVKKNIINCLLRILNIEEINDDENRAYTKRKLLQFLIAKGNGIYEDFKLKIYQWCISVIRGQIQHVLNEIRQYIPAFLSYFGKNINSSREFIDGNHYAVHEEGINIVERENVLTENGVRVEVTTIHSVKGQTHTGTLYMESFYQRGGGGNYESERLSGWLCGNSPAAGMHEFVKQSLKMVYVGFSRPTHFLGFAVHKTRFDTKLSAINKDIWEIIVVD